MRSEVGRRAESSSELPRWVALAAAVGLFLVWSNSFIAVSYLLGGEGRSAQLDWVSLTVARFLTAGLVCAAYCVIFRWRESVELVRRHPVRLLVCGFLAVPLYNLALYYGQQHGVAAPIASLTTALLPLFVMLLSALFLAERLTARKLLGFAVAASGMALVATARTAEIELRYPLLLAITALAPLSWSFFTVLSKPLAGRSSPVVWSYLATAIGMLMILPFAPGEPWRDIVALDPSGWGALLYLALPCTVLGFAVWTWLLRHLPASAVGFTVFLNPPLTSASKMLLAVIAPAVFTFTVLPREWLGGLVTLVGMGVAVTARRRAIPPETAPNVAGGEHG